MAKTTLHDDFSGNNLDDTMHVANLITQNAYTMYQAKQRNFNVCIVHKHFSKNIILIRILSIVYLQPKTRACRISVLVRTFCRVEWKGWKQYWLPFSDVSHDLTCAILVQSLDILCSEGSKYLLPFVIAAEYYTGNWIRKLCTNYLCLDHSRLAITLLAAIASVAFHSG